MRSRIVGTGSYLPEKVLTNRDLESMVDTTDEWIVARTGIRERHIAADGQATSDLALLAARQAPPEAARRLRWGLQLPDVGSPRARALVAGWRAEGLDDVAIANRALRMFREERWFAPA